MKWMLALLLLIINATSPPRPVGPDERFRLAQLRVFDAHVKMLADEGRAPSDWGDAYTELGEYGWHSASDVSVAAAGASPSLAVLSHGGGAFGAYSFSPDAFAQAKRCWWIHGVMEAGSDLLRPVNRNARFTTWCDSWVQLGGAHTSSSPPCVNTMGSPVGYKVKYIAGTDKAGKFVYLRDATVVEVPTYSDGSSMNVLRLDKKAPGFMMTYDIAIVPQDYMNMCACSVPTTVTTEP